MRVLIVNSVCGFGSTGRLCAELAEAFEKNGDQVKVAYGRMDVPEPLRRFSVRIGTALERDLHGLRTRLLDEHGFGSKQATRRFLRWADSYDPDLLWLHNLHGYYINVELLFQWIKSRPGMKVNWTLHDCWAFTGHCAYFTAAGCAQWRERCRRCPQPRSYPACLGRGNCSKNFDRKRAAFTGVPNMTLITPSRWLAGLVGESFLKDYPVRAEPNQVDRTVFRPTPCDLRRRLGLEGKKLVLGVASVWDERKGLGDLLELARMLPESYAVVLVGLDRRQLRQLPKRYPFLRRVPAPQEGAARFLPQGLPAPERSREGALLRTENGVAVPAGVENLYWELIDRSGGGGAPGAQVFCLPRIGEARELAGVYTAADAFVNPSREDTYCTTLLEAQACHTWSVTYGTGGSQEALKNSAAF